jgi:hypothetical protein
MPGLIWLRGEGHQEWFSKTRGGWSMSAAHRDGLNLTEYIVNAPHCVIVKLK